MKSERSEAELLPKCDSAGFERPNATVDVVIFTVLDEALQVLTVKRSEPPYQGWWSLVGGFIDVTKDSRLEETARRKLKEKTGLSSPYLEQFGSVGNNKRDPRGWSISTVYFALIRGEGLKLTPGEGAGAIKWSKVAEGRVAERLAFDHAEILAGCWNRLRNKVLYTSLPVHLMPPSFTLGELQKVYELIIGAKVEHKSFRRRMMSADILEETGQFRHEAKRPARLYRPVAGAETHFFVRNIEGAG